ncbi:MAG: ComEA family DNA-binding protein [Actinobacteria bacterium]|nr:ComEA family DNA-binding protein [Actinomycetota bacterium]
MPDTVAPPAAPGRGPAEAPDPEFWGPPGPTRRERRDLARPSIPAGALDRLLDRTREWRSDARAGVAALVVLALVAGIAWYRIGLGSGGGAGASPDAPAPAAVSTTSASGTSAGGDLTVHVAGAVVQPGVMELPDGARVIDAVEAAGGGLPEADLDRMNLAAKLVDGQRVLVQRVGDPAAPADPSGAGIPGAEGAPPSSEPVNVNTATQEQLETLPGIGPTLAQAIIAERDRRGGFRSVNELRDVRGIGDKRFADIEGLVTV